MARITPIFKGTVDHRGLFLPDSSARLKEWLLSLRGKRVQMAVDVDFHKRTNSENRYYWGVIVDIIGKELGYMPDDAHAFLKNLFLKKGLEYKGVRIEVVRSTADLSTSDFERYCEQIRQWAAIEIPVVIPLPGEALINDSTTIL